MGTDIHPVVQVQEGGRWVDVAESTWPRARGRSPEQTAWIEKYDISPLDRRNYVLFAVLANVRNGFGFAGVYTHDPVTFIQHERGYPEDFVQLHNEHGETYMGDHDHGWVTLRELLEYDWDQPLAEGGLLNEVQYLKWDGKSMPDEWCGGVSGKDIVILDPWEYRTHRPRNPKLELYIRCTWTAPLRQSIPGWVEDVLPWLKSLGAPEDVRIVFGFDS